MIKMEQVCKSYRIAKRNAGFTAACKALFRREHEVIQALDHVSFTIDDGEMVGYIGPNGAGKSSTIKILSGILTPDAGKVLVDGRVPYKNRIEHVRQIGVVFGQRSQLWWDVPVNDSFMLLKDIYSIPDSEYKHNLDELTELLDLKELLRSPARQLSLGQRMRCEIAASLLHSPRILFLDEPTIGLDAVSKLAVRDFIRKRNASRGTTVILTTHDMQDIEALASRIILIGRGRILLDGTLEDIRKAMRISTRQWRSCTVPIIYSRGGARDEKIFIFFPPEIYHGAPVPRRGTGRRSYTIFLGFYGNHDISGILQSGCGGVSHELPGHGVLPMAAAGVPGLLCGMDDGE